MKKLIPIFVFGMFMLTFVVAQNDVFKAGEDIDLKVLCLRSGGYCSGAAICNITSLYPNNTAIVENVLMQNQVFIHNYTLSSSQTVTVGEYTVIGFCLDASTVQEIDFSFEVTKNGTILSIGESILYFLLAGFSFIIFVGMTWLGVGLPFTNPRNDVNKVIGIERLKYAKLGAITLSYAFFVWFINLMFTISTNLVSLTQFSGFFEMLFTISTVIVWPFFVTMFIIFFITAARDLKLTDLLTRGINPR